MSDAPNLFERIQAELDPCERLIYHDERQRIEMSLPTPTDASPEVCKQMRQLMDQNALLVIAVTKARAEDADRARREAAKTKQFRVFRILTYTGSYEFLQRNFARLGVPLRGSHEFGGGSISSVVVGELPELLTEDDPAGAIIDAATALDLFKSNVESQSSQ